MEQGWDPEVKRYFRKIISSLSMGLLWLMGSVTAGLYFQLGYRKDISVAFVILFYVLMVVGLLLLIRFYLRIWKK